jgi:hypothetical protein
MDVVAGHHGHFDVSLIMPKLGWRDTVGEMLGEPSFSFRW